MILMVGTSNLWILEEKVRLEFNMRVIDEKNVCAESNTTVVYLIGTIPLKDHDVAASKFLKYCCCMAEICP